VFYEGESATFLARPDQSDTVSVPALSQLENCLKQLPPKEADRVTAEINRARAECGCSTAAVFCFVSLSLALASIAILIAIGNFTWWKVGMLSGAVMISTIVGKLVGIGRARWRLRALLLELPNAPG
jgi:hypothetical protein